MRLCTGEPDPVKRLQLNSAEYQRLKYSVSPILSVSMMMIAGSLPAWVMQPFYNDTTITTSITNFSGGFDQMSFEGCPCVDTMFVTGIGPLGMENICDCPRKMYLVKSFCKIIIYGNVL